MLAQCYLVRMDGGDDLFLSSFGVEFRAFSGAQTGAGIEVGGGCTSTSRRRGGGGGEGGAGGEEYRAGRGRAARAKRGIGFLWPPPRGRCRGVRGLKMASSPGV